jgi:hypothetical protein
MRRLRAACTLIAALVLGALSACTGTGTPGPRLSPSRTTESAVLGDAFDCHVGIFTVTGIRNTQDTATPLGEIRVAAAPGVLTLTMRFDGTWTVVADPSAPMTLQAGNVSGKVTADGDVEGTYQRTGDTIDFTVTQVTGGVTSRLGHVRRTDPLDRFAGAIAPSGSTIVACGANGLQLGSAAIRMTLTRVTDTSGPPSGLPTAEPPSPTSS